MPLFLLTNDDGYGAPGLEALAAALSPLGEVAIIAPDRERSGCARSISLHHPLRISPRGPLRWAISGTPSDAVYVGIHHLLPRPPDLVLSGINRGPNLAEDIHYSGTAAGAIEGAMNGLRAAALSLSAGADYSHIAAFAARLAAWMLKRPAPLILNVNAPQGAPKGVRLAPLGRRDYSHTVEARVDPRGKPYVWIGGALGFKPTPGSDCDLNAEGYLTLTPLRLDQTDHQALGALEGLDLEAEGLT
ncbi:5'/3'-nucleotidase SurE [Myxococcota bacterium]|nr:5'/3'-nucleotidase SurE [Myxococcota bacterium]MBU1431438.1 5'/3'-nucleotidase SurE [Myxococcota bacterium]MBU1899117.1 5'/3'-nucleotidase SurE [Myxococcota bacterium]